MILISSLVAPSQGNQVLVVVVDDSGSMLDALRSEPRTSKMDAAKRALSVVLGELPLDCEVGLLALNGGQLDQQGHPRWIVALGPNDRSSLLRGINELNGAGWTPLGEATKMGVDVLLQRREIERYSDYRLLVVTDGEANDRFFLESILPDVMSRGIWIDVIGVDMVSDHSLATRVHRYRRADDSAALQAAVTAAVAESTWNDSDPSLDASDLELFVGFPDDVAQIVLTNLATVRNDPIVAGEIPPDVTWDPSVSPVPQGNFGSSWALLGSFCFITLCGSLVFTFLVARWLSRR